MDGEKKNEGSVVCTGWLVAVKELGEGRAEDDSGFLAGIT